MSAMSAVERGAVRLLDGRALQRAVRRLAHEVVERHPGLDGVVLAAIRDGGVPVAALLRGGIADIAGTTLPLALLDVGAYRDDRPQRRQAVGGALTGDDGGAPPAVDGRTVILVDDVVHTGRTLRAALDLLADHGRPAAVEPLVLVDRGRRELPLRATYVGKNVPAADNEWVEVLLRDVPEGQAGAYLVRRS